MDVNRQDTVAYDADEVFAETQDQVPEVAAERRQVRRRREPSPVVVQSSVATGSSLGADWSRESVVST